MSAPEILAPAGSADALKAAVRCGAAAVYLGTDAFNARQHAQNFAGDALREAVEYCRVRGVKVHLTLNTLIRENEMPQALAVARRACALGIDALIVQDVGLARRIHAAAPALPLHASTQLSCHTPDGVRFLRDNGFSRVVLAREMSLEEIGACAGLGCELEVFVHGALCMCVSGQCYLSAALGGRSGNRGLCAQPCRLPFSAEGTPDATGRYALSLRDQSLVPYIPALAAAGVTSLKIEGRMKRPEYVAAATAVCRAAADGKPISDQALADLEAVFSRSGFTDGYYTAKRGAPMFGIRRQEDVVSAAPVLGELAATYQKEVQSVPITLHLTADTAKPTVLTAADADGHTVTVTGEAAQPARTAPTSPEKAAAQLQKTGDTPFAATVTAHIGANAMLPASALNALRREALSALTDLRAAPKTIPFSETLPAKPTKTDRMFSRVIRLAGYSQYGDALRDETVILPLSTPDACWQQLRKSHRGALGVEVPRGLFGNSSAVRAALARVRDAGVTLALCGNCNAIYPAKAAGFTLIGGFGLNLTNADAVDFYAANGVDAMLLSPELSFAQMRFAETASRPCGVFLYGRLPLMLTRNCPRAAAGADCRDCSGGVLRDRRRAAFPVMCENGCAELLNAVPHDWADKQAEVPRGLFGYFHFTTENADAVAKTLERYRSSTPAAEPITRGMYRKGVL